MNFRVVHLGDPVPTGPLPSVNYVHQRPYYFINSKDVLDPANIPAFVENVILRLDPTDIQQKNTSIDSKGITAHGTYINRISACSSNPKVATAELFAGMAVYMEYPNSTSSELPADVWEEAPIVNIMSLASEA